MKAIITLVLGLLLCGCVRVGIERPVGTPVTWDKLGRYEGDWINSDYESFYISIDEAPPQVTAVAKTKTGAEVRHFTVTKVGDALIAWDKADDLDAYLPGRVISDSDDDLVVLFPDAKTVKRLVESGALQGRYDEEKFAWTLSAEEIEEVLAGNEFWGFGATFSLIREKPQHTPIAGKVQVWHLDGTKSEFEVVLDRTKPSFVTIAEGVRLKIEVAADELAERTFHEPNATMVMHSLEITTDAGTKESMLPSITKTRGRKYYFVLCESLYSGDPRWSVDRPLSGTVPGRVDILSLEDLSVAKTVDFEVDLGKVTRVQLDEMFTIQIVSSWESMGGVEFNYHIERREPDGTGYMIESLPFSVLPGSAFYLKYLPLKHSPESQKPLPPLPTKEG